MPISHDSDKEPEVPAFYWLAVCGGSAASDAFLFPQKPPSDVLGVHPILMLPEFPAALESIGQIASDDPTLPELCRRKAEQLRQMQSRLRERFPRMYANLMNQIGILLANEGQPDGKLKNRLVNMKAAIACFKRVRFMPEDQVDGNDLFFSLMHEANMLAMLAGLRQDSPDNIRKAVNRLERAVSLSTDTAEREKLLNRLGEYRAFQQALGPSANGETDDRDVLWQRAASLGAAGNAQGALKIYDWLLDLDPGDFDSWIARGDLLFDLGRFGDAVESYTKVVERHGDHADAWAGVARALAAQAKWGECLACANEALKLDHYNERAQAARAAALAHVSPSGEKS